MQGKKAAVKTYEQKSLALENLQSTIDACPVHAIEYFEE